MARFNALSLTSLLLFLSTFSSLSRAQTGATRNRTFTLTAYNSDYPFLDNTPVTRNTPTGSASAGVKFPSNYDLHAFIWNNVLYRYCDAPSGICIGYWRKNYRGVLTGWVLAFNDDESYSSNDPCCSVDGSWSVSTVDGHDYLTNYDTTTFQLCDVDPNATGTMWYNVRLSNSISGNSANTI